MFPQREKATKCHSLTNIIFKNLTSHQIAFHFPYLSLIDACLRQLITLIEPLMLQVTPALSLGDRRAADPISSCNERPAGIAAAHEGERDVIDEALLYKAPHYSCDKSNVISDASQNIRRTGCTLYNTSGEPYN